MVCFDANLYMIYLVDCDGRLVATFEEDTDARAAVELAAISNNATPLYTHAVAIGGVPAAPGTGFAAARSAELSEETRPNKKNAATLAAALSSAFGRRFGVTDEGVYMTRCDGVRVCVLTLGETADVEGVGDAAGLVLNRLLSF